MTKEKIKYLCELAREGMQFDDLIKEIDKRLGIDKEVDLNQELIQVNSLKYLRLLNIAKLAIRDLIYYKNFMDSNEFASVRFNALFHCIDGGIRYADEKNNYPNNFIDHIFERPKF
jgi:hypothetical protein